MVWEGEGREAFPYPDFINFTRLADHIFQDGLIIKEAAMKLKMRCVIGLAVIMTLCFLGTGLAADKTLTISAGPMGGDWYSLGGALGEMAKEAMPGTVVTVTTGGAVVNLPKINAGQGDLGLTMAKLYHEALTGTESFANRRKQENVRVLAGALEGWYFRPIGWTFRLPLFVSGILMIIPGLLTDLVGLAVFLGISAWCRFKKSSRTLAPS